MCGNVESQTWSHSFLCNGGFNVALINLKNGLLRQPPPNSIVFPDPSALE